MIQEGTIIRRIDKASYGIVQQAINDQLVVIVIKLEINPYDEQNIFVSMNETDKKTLTFEKDIWSYNDTLEIRKLTKQETEYVLRHEILNKVSHYYESTFKPAGEVGFDRHSTFLPYGGRVFDQSEMISLVDASLDFWLTSGRYHKQFEKEFAQFLGVRYALLTNSGSSANLLAFSALTSPKLKERRILPGDEVITVAAGFPTTVTPIIQNGAVPVFIDIDLETYNLNVNYLEDALTSKTKAIMIAHTMGNPFNLEKIASFAKQNNLWLIEDNCDALGSLYNGKLTGTFGDLATSSFYPPHHMTMGEGGAVYTNNALLKSIVESFRDWGRDCWCESGCDNTCNRRFDWQLGDLPKGYDHKYTYSHIGYNLKVTDMQASIGVEQLKKLPQFISQRIRNFNRLASGLKDLEKYFILPKATENSEPSWFGYILTVRKDAGFTKDQIVKYLESKRIQTRMLFAGNLVRQPAFAEVNYRIASPLVNTDIVLEHTFLVGVYPGLTDDMIDYIIDTIYTFVAGQSNQEV